MATSADPSLETESFEEMRTDEALTGAGSVSAAAGHRTLRKQAKSDPVRNLDKAFAATDPDTRRCAMGSTPPARLPTLVTRDKEAP